ncbi:MAG: hypothetical protein V8R46_08180 [Eubacterium ramulus]
MWYVRQGDGELDEHAGDGNRYCTADADHRLLCEQLLPWYGSSDAAAITENVILLPVCAAKDVRTLRRTMKVVRHMYRIS